ncbi:MAG: zinc ribbon domain-containing protein [Aigarchaeota archaeon]|nr:zinc ribbon domain-containing protein [Candidatus Pelearchaeum maunauluense]
MRRSARLVAAALASLAIVATLSYAEGLSGQNPALALLSTALAGIVAGVLVRESLAAAVGAGIGSLAGHGIAFTQGLLLWNPLAQQDIVVFRIMLSALTVVIAAGGGFLLRPKAVQQEEISAEEVPQQKSCPECGSVAPSEAIYCPMCGRKLEEIES